MRIREILDSLTPAVKKKLFNLLPPGCEFETVGISGGYMPAAIKTALEAKFPGNGASMVGIITEQLLKVKNVTIADFSRILKDNHIELDLGPIIKSKTTQRYFDSVNATRKLLEEHLEDASYDVVLTIDDIEGHPDIINDQIIFEVKTSTNLKASWNYFLLQLFAYAVLSPAQTHVCLVLPLQAEIFCIDVSDWKQRDAFLAILKKKVPTQDRMALQVLHLQMTMKYGIGSHIAKQPKLLSTLTGLDPSLPYQIFLGSQFSVKITVKDADLAASSDLVSSRRMNMFVHAPYIINLGRPWNDPSCRQWDDSTGDMIGYHIEGLKRQLQVASTLGAKGVIVHLGNHKEHKREDSNKYMWENIQYLLEFATVECPLLLETGVGEGSEICWEQDDFRSFVASINDPRFGVCLDTAHVHAAGYDIMPFLEGIVDRLRLVHYNDCKSDKGSHRDLHELVGAGTIPLESLVDVAEFCTSRGIAMVHE
jgi:deoxyribonuclease-4